MDYGNTQFDDSILDILFKIKEDQGDDHIFKNVRRVKALLMDYMPSAKKEIVQIVNLLEINAYFRLKNRAADRDFLVSALFSQLTEEYNVTAAAAIWGIGAMLKLLGDSRPVQIHYEDEQPSGKARLASSAALKNNRNKVTGARGRAKHKLLLAPGHDFIAYVKNGEPGVYNNKELHQALEKCHSQGIFGEIQSISAGLRTVAVLTEQGDVFLHDGRRWLSNIRQIACGNFYILALGKDGQVHLRGGDTALEGLDKWGYIRSIASAGFTAAAVDSKSEIVVAGDDTWGHSLACSWENIYKLSINQFNISAVKSNGKGLCAGDNSCNQLDMENFHGLENIFQGALHTVGLKTNRTLVGAGDNSFGQLNFSHWRGIKNVFAGDRFTVGISLKGEFFLAGESILWSGFCKDILEQPQEGRHNGGNS